MGFSFFFSFFFFFSSEGVLEGEVKDQEVKVKCFFEEWDAYEAGSKKTNKQNNKKKQKQQKSADVFLSFFLAGMTGFYGFSPLNV